MKQSMPRTGEALFLLAVGAGPLHGQSSCEPGRWEFETRYTVEANDALPLSRIWDLEVGPDGSVYLSHGFDPEVVVLDGEGSQRGTIGRAGSGPGEFADAPRLLAWRGDTLVAGDRFNTLLLGPDGHEYRRVGFSTPVPEETSTFVAGTILADGSWLGRRLIHSPIESFIRPSHLPLRRFTDSGQIVDTITWVRQAPAILAGDRDARGNYELTARHPFSWTEESWLPVVSTKDGGAVVLEGVVERGGETVPALMKISIEGDTLWAHQLPVGNEIPRRTRARLREAFGALQAGDFSTSLAATRPTSTSERMRRLAERSIDFPERFPSVRQIVAGDDGSVWVLRESGPEEFDVWDVYDGDGHLRGSLPVTEGRTGPLPWTPKMLLLQATVEAAWGVTYDEFGIPTLHSLAVRKSCSRP